MFSSRLLWKIYAGYAAVILLSSILLGGLVTQWIKSDSLDDIRSQLQSQALMLKAIATKTSGDKNSALQNQIRELGLEIGSRLTLIGADGDVVADSRENPASMDNHANRPEILSARSHGYGSSTRYSDTIKTNMMYYAIPLSEDGRRSGYVRTSISLAKVDEKLSRLNEAVAIGAGIAVIAALVFGYFMALGFSRPIESMTKAAESIAEGRYEEKLEEKRDDEIGALAKALNRMAGNLKERIETISGERNKLEAILDGMVEGVIAINSDELIVHINKTACDIAGASLSQSVGKPLWEVIQIKELNDIISRTLKEKAKVEKEISIIGKTGDRHIQIISSPTFTLEGAISGAVIMLHDITELYALDRIRRDFVANVSHELKTPITAIRALIETIIDDENISEEDKKSFHIKIKKQSIRLSTLVSDVLTLARIESGKGATDNKNIDLRDLVNDVIGSLFIENKESEIKVVPEIVNEPVKIVGDEEAIIEAVRNLTDNALKYTPANGVVYIRLKAIDGKAIIEVEDSGVGIEPAHQQRIFERFYRVDKARSRELGGTGLGLAIVKHVAISHGGRVELQSESGKGSLFRIILPLAN
jgi:two-component system phosphate regulon sensor histidine kinase PhoR